MALLEILEFPNPKLRTKAAQVETVDERVQAIVRDMLDTMYDASGVGLAATQVDIHEQIIVIDVSESRDEPQVFINPSIEIVDEEQFEYDEGCLSVPGFYEAVTRPKHVRVTALNEQGESFTIEPEGLLAVCIQHEMDHLQGKLFVDYVSNFKRNRIRNKLLKKQRTRA